MTSPVFFCFHPNNWPSDEVVENKSGGTNHYFINTDWNWVLQTYLRLRERGRPVVLAKELPQEGIIVLCSGTVPLAYKPGPRQFLVSINADEAPDVFAQMHITQNRIQARIMPDSHDVPHWPQPGLMKRDESRGASFSSLAYFGDDKNLAAELRTPRWSEFLASRAIAWHVRNAASQRNTDFTDIDAVIGVRSFQHSGYIRKPGSKLFNAWIAGVPAILGRELAFREQRQSELDYIEVGSFDETCAAIDRLAASPALRQAMIENGRRRAEEISVGRITDRWEKLLFETAQDAAQRWFARSAAGRERFFFRCLLEKKVRGASHRILRGIGREQYAI